jgi:hypothetical protein
MPTFVIPLLVLLGATGFGVLLVRCLARSSRHLFPPQEAAPAAIAAAEAPAGQEEMEARPSRSAV